MVSPINNKHMSARTKLRTFSSIADQRCRLINSSIARLWGDDVGTDWTTIRVGCRISIDDSGADITSTPRFAYGICSGITNPFISATTDHWLGGLLNDATLTRAVGPPKRYTGGDGLCAAKRIGNTNTIGSSLTQIGFGQQQFTFYYCGTANRSVLFLDITKGDPNFTLQVKLFAGYGYGSSEDVSIEEFLTQLPLSSPALIGHYTTASVDIAVDEAADGFFNAVNISWDRTSPAIEVSDVKVVQLA